jgi:hypothetical protein
VLAPLPVEKLSPSYSILGINQRDEFVGISVNHPNPQLRQRILRPRPGMQLQDHTGLQGQHHHLQSCDATKRLLSWCLNVKQKLGIVFCNTMTACRICFFLQSNRHSLLLLLLTQIL